MIHMGVSTNGDTPKWMVYNGKAHSNGCFFGVCTPILGNLRTSLTQWNICNFPRCLPYF